MRFQTWSGWAFLAGVAPFCLIRLVGGMGIMEEAEAEAKAKLGDRVARSAVVGVGGDRLS